MTKPVEKSAGARVVDRRGKSVELEPGEHHWCACGRSLSQPLCDGSHAGTDFEPLAFTLDEPRRVKLCLCKRSGNPPYCDGSHNRISLEEMERSQQD